MRKGWYLWTIGDFKQAIGDLTAGLGNAEAAGSLSEAGFALMTQLWCELALGDLGNAESAGHAALDALDTADCMQQFAQTTNSPGLQSFANMIAAWPHALRGSYSDARAIAQQATNLASELADMLFAHGTLAWINALDSGDRTALDVLTQASATFRGMGFRAMEMFTLYLVDACPQAAKTKHRPYWMSLTQSWRRIT